jgi:LPXTG-site transpeptidase (sortase) family protein
MDISYFLEQKGIVTNPYIKNSDYEGLVQGLSTVKSTDNSNTDNTYVQLIKNLPISSYEDFGILIPKIKADSPVVPNVDPLDINVYKEALGKGIAHASTSALPGEPGNAFLFAHSGRNFYDSIGVNVQFYLLDKLEIGDLVIVNHEGKKYIYQVALVKIVEQTDSEYMFRNFKLNDESSNTLTLMSCWPAGMNVKRQIVISHEIGSL